MKKMIMGFAAAVLVISNIFGYFLMNAMAGEPKEPVRERYYKSITIEEGDSLWAIADTYCHDLDVSVNAYVEELKQMNHLKEDTIHAGNHLTVVYVASSE